MRGFIARRALMLFAFLMGVSACQSDAVIVTGQAAGAPPGCSAHDVAQRLVDLFDAINRGDPNVVPEFFGRKESERFQWYSIGESGKAGTAENFFVAHRLDELAAYFVQRHAQHEHLQLRRLKVNGWDEGRGLVHFGPVEFTRTADDLVLPPADMVAQGTGKGAYHCEGRAFVVLSLVSPPSDSIPTGHSIAR